MRKIYVAIYWIGIVFSGVLLFSLLWPLIFALPIVFIIWLWDTSAERLGKAHWQKYTYVTKEGSIMAYSGPRQPYMDETDPEIVRQAYMNYK